MNEGELQTILNSSRYLTLSTVDDSGQVWACPLWYVHSGNSFYWWSPKDSQHSKNILKNPSAMITIFDSSASEGDGFGAYFKVECAEVDVNEAEKIIHLYNESTKVFKLNTANCSKSAPTRIYSAKIIKAWVNDSDEIDGYYIDTRKDLDF